MSAVPDAPSFGALLAPLLGKVSTADRPRFLALLERTAAARYRAWADEWPHHREALLTCAASEDQIADRIEASFTCAADTLAEMQRILPAARDIYYGVFDGLPVVEQLRLQAAAELQGAAAWRHVAAGLADDADRQRMVDVLQSCSALEEQSSRLVTQLLAEG